MSATSKRQSTAGTASRNFPYRLAMASCSAAPGFSVRRSSHVLGPRHPEPAPGQSAVGLGVPGHPVESDSSGVPGASSPWCRFGLGHGAPALAWLAIPCARPQSQAVPPGARSSYQYLQVEHSCDRQGASELVDSATDGSSVRPGGALIFRCRNVATLHMPHHAPRDPTYHSGYWGIIVAPAKSGRALHQDLSAFPSGTAVTVSPT